MRLVKFMIGVLLVINFVLPALAQDVPTAIPVTAQAFRAINVRSGPSTMYDVIGRIDEGNIVPVLGRSDAQSNWLLVDNNGEIGWVAYFTVVVTGDPTTLEIVEDTDSAGTSISPLEFTPQSAPVTAAETELYVSSYRRVNVRSGPGTEFSIVGVLAPGETADIIGTSGEDNEWLEIDFNGEHGWVAYFVVNVSGDLSALEITGSSDDVFAASSIVAPSIALPAPTLDSNQVLLITRFNTNLRAEPQFGSPVITVVPYETTLEAEARTADNSWLRVTYEGQTGWLIASLVNTGVSDVNSLPIDTPSPTLNVTETPASPAA